MRANTPSVRQSKYLYVKPSAGVDMTSSPMDVGLKRGAYMRNLIGSCGSLSKRTGWRQMTRLYTEDENAMPQYGRIHNMWHFEDGITDCMIVHAGERLYRVDPETWAWWDLNITVQNKRTCGIMLNGRLWLIGAGALFAFGTWDGGETYVIRRAAELEDVYIPTTTIGINDTQNPETDHRTSHEPINMLTTKRKNKMMGRKKEEGETALYYALDADVRFVPQTTYDSLLVEEIPLMCDLTVETEVIDENGQTKTLKVVPWEARYIMRMIRAGTWEYTFYTELVAQDEKITREDCMRSDTTDRKLFCSEKIVYGKKRYEYKGDDIGYEDTEYTPFEPLKVNILPLTAAGFDKNAYIFEDDAEDDTEGQDVEGIRYEDMQTTISGTDNITVTFDADTEDLSYIIDSATIGFLFGENNLTDRLLLAGFDEFKNRVYFSEHGNPLYFPETNYFEVGSDRSRIIGFSRVSDGVLAVHKEDKGEGPTIYYVSMTGSGNDDTMNYTVTPCATAGNRSEEIMSDSALCDFYGRPLVLTKIGIEEVTLRDNLNTTERQLVERSRSIREEIATRGRDVLSGAIATVHDGRYYLSMPDGICYVAINGETYRDENGGTQYEWYVLDGIPATAFCSVEGRLYFGCADGRICIMSRESDAIGTDVLWADRTHHEFGAHRGQVTYDYTRGELTYNADTVPMEEGDGITFHCDIYEMLSDDSFSFASVSKKFKLDNIEETARYREGMTVCYEHGNTFTEDLTVTDINRIDGTFKLYRSDGTIYSSTVACSGDRIMRPLRDDGLIIGEVDEENSTVKIKRYREDAEYLQITVPKGKQAPEIVGEIIHDEPVCAEWYSGMLDMGDNLQEKTLHSVTVSLNPGSGRVTVGYTTRHGNEAFRSNGVGGLDLGDLTFRDFSLNGFAESYTRMINNRHVNYIRLRFISETATPCSVHDITVEYVTVGNKRGGL